MICKKRGVDMGDGKEMKFCFQWGGPVSETETENRKDERLSWGTLVREKSELEGRINILFAEIEKYKKKLYDDKCADAREPDTASQLGQFAFFETLTREMVEAFVEQIYICQDGSLRIQWKSYGNGNRVKSAWREEVGLALSCFVTTSQKTQFLYAIIRLQFREDAAVSAILGCCGRSMYGNRQSA